jgi:quinol monooxygenase YgiN
VPFFVAVQQEVQSERLDEMLATIRGDFATSQRSHPGRRTTRVFQRLSYPTHLLAIGEWDSQADYERLRQTETYQQATVRANPPASIAYLKRLRYFARLSASPTVVASVKVTAPRHHAESLESFMLELVPHEVESAAGLTSNEVYRIGDEPGRLLIVHSWRSIEDLERFRTRDRRGYVARLQELEAVSDRMTGVVAAQFSRLEIEEPIRATSPT